MNTCDHKNKKIILYPDFSSTGIWCECGVSFSDPIEKFPHVPKGIFMLVQLWNNQWDDLCFRDSYRDGLVTKEIIGFHQERINIMGEELSKIISKYHSCIFDKKNSEILISGETDE